MEIHADRETLEFLQDNLGAIEVFEVDGEKYFGGNGKIVRPPEPSRTPRAESLELRTLTGFVDSVIQNIDDVDLEKYLVVAEPAKVILVSGVRGYHRDREVPVVARHEWDDSWLGIYQTIQKTLLILGSHFERRGDLGRLIDLLSDVTLSDTKKQKREGLGFRVTTETGVAGGGDGWTEVENPFFELHPFRSFPEAGPQVASTYLLDLQVHQDDVKVGLTLADGGAWRAHAAEAVGKTVQQLFDDMGADPTPSVVW